MILAFLRLGKNQSFYGIGPCLIDHFWSIIRRTAAASGTVCQTRVSMTFTDVFFFFLLDSHNIRNVSRWPADSVCANLEACSQDYSSQLSSFQGSLSSNYLHSFLFLTLLYILSISGSSLSVWYSRRPWMSSSQDHCSSSFRPVGRRHRSRRLFSLPYLIDWFALCCAVWTRSSTLWSVMPSRLAR